MVYLRESAEQAFATLLKKQQSIFPPLDRRTVRGLQVVVTDKRSVGRRRLENFQRCFQKISDVAISKLGAPGCNFSQVHWNIYAKYLEACIQHIVGVDNFNYDPMYFKSLLRKRCASRFVVVIMPRRWGKTFISSAFIAALILAAPNMSVNVYSPAKRASQSLLTLIINITKLVRGDALEIIRNNMETFVIQGDEGPADERTCNSYPGALHTLRGTGAKVIFAEEMFAMNPLLFKKILAPILTVGNTVFMGISTPQDTNNPFERLLKTELHSRPLFRVIKYSPACDACQEAKEANNCSHNASLIPPWISQRGMESVKLMLDKNDYEAEILGLTSAESVPVFPERFVSEIHMLEADPTSFFKYHYNIFIACDPTSGCFSELALMSFTYTPDGKLCVSHVNVPHNPRHGQGRIGAVGQMTRVEFGKRGVHHVVRRGILHRGQPNRLARHEKPRDKAPNTLHVVERLRFSTRHRRAGMHGIRVQAKVAIEEYLKHLKSVILVVQQPVIRARPLHIAQILGAETEPLGGAEYDVQEKLIRSHVSNLHAAYKQFNPRYITIVEGNMAWIVANIITTMIENCLPPNSVAHIGREGKNGVTMRGVMTTMENKLNMAASTRYFVQSKRLCYAKKFVCTGMRQGISDPDDRRDDIIYILKDQCNNMRQYTHPFKGMHGNDKVFISGKGGGKNDDLCMTLLLGTHFSQAALKKQVEFVS